MINLKDSNFNGILEDITKTKIQNIIITGGHFRIFFDEAGLKLEINPGTIKSFELAIDLYKKLIQNKINSTLGILINDMGFLCDEESCYIKQYNFSRDEFVLPKVYRKLLYVSGIGQISKMNSNNITGGPLQIYWEKNIRNRAKKEFLRMLKRTDSKPMKDKEESIKKTIIKEPAGFYIEDSEQFGKIILTRTRGKDKYGAPACPLIMAGLNILQAKQKYSMSVNFYYIGQDNIENIPNHFVIEKGKKTTALFGYNIKVINIYFDKF